MADDRARTESSRVSESEPAPRNRGRPLGDREGKRAELLKAAISVIADEGFAGASLRKVAQRAGCTTGAVTYYFSNKETMMAAVIESRFDVFDSMLGGSGRKVNIKAGFERSLFLTQQEETGGWVAGFQILAHARHDPALAAVYAKRYTHYREAFASILAEGQRQGEIRDDIPADLLADQLSAMADGWMMMIPIEEGRFQPERLRALIDATVALVAPQRPAQHAARA